MNQYVYAGERALRELPSILTSCSVSSALIFCGRTSFEASGAAAVIESIRSRYRFDVVTIDAPVPEVTDLGSYVRRIESFRPDALIAIGGGHVLDTAKLVNVIAANREDFEPGSIAAFTPKVKGRPLIAVPTTAGSGSEATHFAVVYSDKRKYSIAAPFMLPTFAVVDPSLLMSASVPIRAISGADALCQAIESLWATGATADSMYFSTEALNLLLSTLEQWVKDPSPATAVRMAKASFLSGKAINIAKTTAPHALSYVLTSEFGVPHGQAVAVFLPSFIDFNFRAAHRAAPATAAPDELTVKRDLLFKLLGVSDGASAVERVSEVFVNIGLKTNLRDLGIADPEHAQTIAASVNLERLKNNPRNASHAELADIIRSLQ